jgi:hypothetical protein
VQGWRMHHWGASKPFCCRRYGGHRILSTSNGRSGGMFSDPREDLRADIPPSLHRMLPKLWDGETNCTIGPFSEKQAAFLYVTYIIAKRMNSLAVEIVPEDTGWFIELHQPK